MSDASSAGPEAVAAGETPFRWVSPAGRRHRALRWLEIGETALGITLILAILAALVAQIVSRRFFEPFTWTDEFVRYANVTLGYTAAALAMAAGSHITVDLLDRFYSRRALGAVRRLSALIVTLIIATVLVVGVPYAFSQTGRSSVALDVPIAGLYAVVLVMLALQGIHALVVVLGLDRPDGDHP